MSKFRAPVRAGTFYPERPRELEQTIRRYLAQVEPTEQTGDLVGLICPHAGYLYSGQTAAYSYGRLRDAVAQGQSFELLVVLSPAHFAATGRFLLTDASIYQTPLGDIRLDRSALQALEQELPIQRIGFDGEHAIEVQLPFLQVILDDFALLPLMIGDPSLRAGEELGQALFRILAGRKALIVASSDMHHINDYAEVSRRDRTVVDAIAGMDLAHIKRVLSAPGCTVCGRVAIIAMLTAVLAAGANRVDVLHYTNSADVTGNHVPGQYTVGYMAAAALRED
jgi:AmmeMemoRadiSam system protein B